MDGNSVATLQDGVRDRIVQNWVAAVEGGGGRSRVALQARGRVLLEGTEAVLRGDPEGLVDRLRRDPQWGLSAIQSLAEELRQLLLFRAVAMEGIPGLTEAQKEALHAAFDRAAVELAKWFEALARAAGDAQLEAERIRDPRHRAVQPSVPGHLPPRRGAAGPPLRPSSLPAGRTTGQL